MDVGRQGGKFCQTPNIDRLPREHARFNLEWITTP
jgi:hypothetical protein